MVGVKGRIVLFAEQDVAVREQQQSRGVSLGDVVGRIAGAIENVAVVLVKPRRASSGAAQRDRSP